MARFATFLICIVLAAVASASPLESVKEEIIVVEDINDYLFQHPSAELTPLSQESNLGVIRYTLGSRIGGDRLIASARNNYNYPTLQNVQLTLTYPSQGVGNVVTFVEIVVNQSSNNGRAYVVRGGIGQRFITIVVEAKGVYSVSYTASYYGY